jgi:hypothetical protein
MGCRPSLCPARSITHTTRYMALSQTRFKDFWRD